MKIPLPSIKKLHKPGWQKETRSSHVWKQSLKKEKPHGLSGKKIKEIFQKIWRHSDCYRYCRRCHHQAAVGSITNAPKATGKALENGLKDIGSKVGSLLPGLIGLIVSFLFKSAGKRSAISSSTPGSWFWQQLPLLPQTTSKRVVNAKP